MSYLSEKIKMDTWRMISTTGKKISAFSLAELIVVLGIIFSLIFAGSLYFQNHLLKTSLKTSCQDIESTILLAKRLAITKRKIHKVKFQPERGKYWIENSEGEKVEGVNYLREGVTFSNPELRKWGEKDGIVEAGYPDNAISFYPQGTAEAGSIYLKDRKNNWCTITILPATGNVRIYWEKH